MTDKLTYFDGRGRAELIRLLYKLGNKEFIDCRVKDEEWPTVQKSGDLPLGQLPILETNGVKLVQCMSIARYVARELKLSGSTSLEQAVCDMICDTCNDVADAIIPIMLGPEEGKEAAAAKVNGLCEGLNRLVKLNKKGKFILGDKPSLADAALFAVAEFLGVTKRTSPPEEVANIAKVFGEVPEIAAWIKVRPETIF